MPGFVVPVLYLFGLINVEPSPHSVTLSLWMLLTFTILYMSFGLYRFVRDRIPSSWFTFQRKIPRDKQEKLDIAIEHFQTVINHTNDLIFKTDLKGNIIYVTPGAERFMGYAEDELLAKNYLELVRDDFRESTKAFYREQYKSGRETTYLELPVITKTGSEIWIGQRIRLMKEWGEVVGYQAVARDISERKRVEQRLESNEELFLQFVKHTPAAVAMFDNEMRYLAVSDRWLSDLEIEGGVIGKTYYEVFPETPDEWREIHQSCLSGVSYTCEEEPLERRDGSVDWLQWEVHPWFEIPGEIGGLIVFKELVTDRKEAEETLLKAKELAEEASRTKSNFISRMSHELRTPLTGILGYSQMLEIDSELTQGQLNQVHQIKSSGEYLLGIINNLLELSRIESGKIEFEAGNLDPIRLIRDLVDEASANYSGNNNRHRIEVKDVPFPAAIYTDASKLNTILGNLIGNAFKFTQKGEVTVSARMKLVDDSGADGLLTVSISDTGPGIPSENRDSIFQPFTQNTEQYNQGTGLGLVLARKYCRYLGGSLNLQSTVGEGSTFTAQIPVQVRDSGKSIPAERLNGTNFGNGLENSEITPRDVSDCIKTLDEDAREVIKRALEMQDLETISQIDVELTSQDNGEVDPLEKLRRSAENYDYRFITEVSRELLN